MLTIETDLAAWGRFMYRMANLWRQVFTLGGQVFNLPCIFVGGKFSTCPAYLWRQVFNLPGIFVAASFQLARHICGGKFSTCPAYLWRQVFNLPCIVAASFQLALHIVAASFQLAAALFVGASFQLALHICGGKFSTCPAYSWQVENLPPQGPRGSHFCPEVIHRPPHPFVAVDLRLPAQQRPGPRDVGPAHLADRPAAAA